MTNDQMVTLLETIRDGRFADQPVDNQLLAEALDASLDSIAAQVHEANARSFLLGTRAARRPGPWYTNLEVSNQGDRFLATHSNHS